jgi:hypothetical protein
VVSGPGRPPNLPPETMATNATPTTDKGVSTVPRGASQLGRDAKGREHYATTMPGATIFIVDDDATETWPVDNDDNPLSDVEDWVEHVRATVGWDQLLYGESLSAMLARRAREERD